MFVTKLQAVFSAVSGRTADMPSGFSGRLPCRRSNAYTTNTLTAEKTIRLRAYCFQSCSAAGSTRSVR